MCEPEARGNKRLTPTQDEAKRSEAYWVSHLVAISIWWSRVVFSFISPQLTHFESLYVPVFSVHQACDSETNGRVRIADEHREEEEGMGKN